MDEYINREEAIKIAESCGTQNASHLGSVYSGSVIADYIAEYISMIPLADVALVRHGRWVTHSDRPDSLICSVCDCGFDMWKHEPHNYCPNCGAKMDGDGNG